MEYDEEKVDEMTLALLWLVMHDGGYGTTRAWKSFDWNTMDRLFEKGFISDPRRKTKSVAVSKTGQARAEELFEKYFRLS
ncbi:MAG: DUF6429 family protein [Thermovirgaceae bacterium]|nr:DUF6429 family protein [Thermovirgaceae bacterium]